MVNGKEIFPIMPEKSWWELRKKFKQSPPSSISTTYLASLFSISQKAAGNIRPVLRRIGLIDEDGSIKDRAYEWRDDEKYAEVCNNMRKELYPQELLDLYPKPADEGRESIARWFAGRSKVGSTASKMMASFYILLSEADLSAESEVKAKPKAEKPKVKPKPKPKVAITEKQEPIDTKIRGGVEEELNIPSVNINIEVHISSDASTTQIDQIFESMARHLKISRKTSNE